MQITVRLFAAQRQALGRAELALELQDGATVEQAWAALQLQHPALAGQQVAFAVNKAYVGPETPLAHGDELACIPPVSGGAPKHFHITSDALDAAPLMALVQTPDDGAVVCFSGVVRNNFGGRATDHLEYEAYAEMAEPVLAQIAAEAQGRWAIGQVAVHHRVGTLAIGEAAVLVVVASPHRQAAFEAAAYIMDRIKEIAPIWKKEVWADGDEEWVGSRMASGDSG